MENREWYSSGANMSYKKLTQRVSLSLILILLAFGLPSTNHNMPKLEISKEKIWQLIKAENELPAPPDKFYKEMILCDENPEITQTLSADIDGDDFPELIVNLQGEEVNFNMGYQRCVVILDMLKYNTWGVKFFDNDISLKSEILLEDLENDGFDDLLVRSDFRDGGSGGFWKKLQNTYIKCNLQKCVGSFTYYSYVIGNTRLWYSWGYYGTSYGVDSAEIRSLGNNKIEKISREISWYGDRFFAAAPRYEAYILSGLEYKKVVSFYGDKTWKESVFPYPVGKELVSNNAFAEALRSGLVKRENIIDVEGAYKGNYPEADQVIILQSLEDHKCKLGKYFFDLAGQFIESSITEYCTPPLTDLQIVKLPSEQGRTYLFLSSVLLPYDTVPPHHFVSIYSPGLFLVDRLVGRLYVAKKDGVTVDCDGENPCKAKVRVWDFEYDSDDLSLPHFDYYIWDAEREKFIPAQP